MLPLRVAVNVNELAPLTGVYSRPLPKLDDVCIKHLGMFPLFKVILKCTVYVFAGVDVQVKLAAPYAVVFIADDISNPEVVSVSYGKLVLLNQVLPARIFVLLEDDILVLSVLERAAILVLPTNQPVL